MNLANQLEAAVNLVAFASRLSDLAYFARVPEPGPRPDEWADATRQDIHSKRLAAIRSVQRLAPDDWPPGTSASDIRITSTDALELVTILCQDRRWGVHFDDWRSDADRRLVDRVEAMAVQARELAAAIEGFSREAVHRMHTSTAPPLHTVPPPPPGLATFDEGNEQGILVRGQPHPVTKQGSEGKAFRLIRAMIPACDHRERLVSEVFTELKIKSRPPKNATVKTTASNTRKLAQGYARAVTKLLIECQAGFEVQVADSTDLGGRLVFRWADVNGIRSGIQKISEKS